jgi:hypothetical protein
VTSDLQIGVGLRTLVSVRSSGDKMTWPGKDGPVKSICTGHNLELELNLIFLLT